MISNSFTRNFLATQNVETWSNMIDGMSHDDQKELVCCIREEMEYMANALEFMEKKIGRKDAKQRRDKIGKAINP